MRQMKESGIEWIGKIPETWEVHPALYFFSEIRDKNTDGSIKKALKFYNGTIVPKTDFNDNSDDYVVDTIANYTVVEPNTIMINGLNLNFDLKSLRVGLVTERGVITSAYLAVWPDESRIDPRYATYLLKCYDSVKAFHNMGVGIRKTLGFNEFKKQPILYPDLETQKRIVAFLDSKCSQIDSIIEKQEAIIEKLKEYKLSVITEAVTKGLDPNVEMQGCDIQWIGEIPKNWCLCRLNDVTDRIIVGLATSVTPYYRSEGVVLLRNLNIKDGYLDDTQLLYLDREFADSQEGKFIEKNDVLTVHTGANLGLTCVVPDEYSHSLSFTTLITTPDSSKLDPRYLMYSINSGLGKSEIERLKCGDIKANLNVRQFKYFSLIVPPIQDQKDIVSMLDAKCKAIDICINEKMSIIDELKEYKKSLIYEVVTGKKEV